MTRHARQGWLCRLRRFSGVGVLLFAIVLAIGSVRAQALALTVGDDDFCVTVSFTNAAAPSVSADDDALASHHPGCCDQGLCHAGLALAPSPSALAQPRRLTFRDRTVAPRRLRLRVRRDGHRPRAPPHA